MFLYIFTSALYKYKKLILISFSICAFIFIFFAITEGVSLTRIGNGISCILVISLLWLIGMAIIAICVYIKCKPSRQLKRISNHIARRVNVQHSVESLLNGSIQTQVDELIDYCYDKIEIDHSYNAIEIKNILHEYKLSKESMRELFWEIVKYGGDQWAGGHYIAASSLAHSATLRYLLEDGVNEETVYNMLLYFEKIMPLYALNQLSNPQDPYMLGRMLAEKKLPRQ